MAATSSMLRLGTKVPDFTLPDTLGSTVGVSNYDGIPAMLVIFMCNHCPYVKHIQEPLAQLVREYQPRGVAVIGINRTTGTAIRRTARRRWPRRSSG
jgi:peroxiredoxin